MDRVVGCLADCLGSDGRWSGSGSTATTTSPSARRTSASDVWVSRKGAIEAQAGSARPHPGFDGHGVVRRRGQGQPGVAALVAARRRPGVLPLDGAPKTFTRRAAARGDGAASSTATPTPSSTRSRRRTRTSTRSWPTPPTSSRSGTRCARSSTSRATDSSQRFMGNGRGAQGPPRCHCRQSQARALCARHQGAPSCSMGRIR